MSAGSSCRPWILTAAMSCRYPLPLRGGTKHCRLRWPGRCRSENATEATCRSTTSTAGSCSGARPGAGSTAMRWSWSDLQKACRVRAIPETLRGLPGGEGGGTRGISGDHGAAPRSRRITPGRNPENALRENLRAGKPNTHHESAAHQWWPPAACSNARKRWWARCCLRGSVRY